MFDVETIIKNHCLWLTTKKGAFGNLFGRELPLYNFRNKILRSMNLSFCDLSGSDFSYADCRYVNFYAADLSGCDFSGADLRYAKLDYAKLENIKYTKTTQFPLTFNPSFIKV